jgi:hypothetical protein
MDNALTDGADVLAHRQIGKEYKPGLPGLTGKIVVIEDVCA